MSKLLNSTAEQAVPYDPGSVHPSIRNRAPAPRGWRGCRGRGLAGVCSWVNAIRGMRDWSGRIVKAEAMPCPMAHCAVLPGSRPRHNHSGMTLLRGNDATEMATAKRSGRRGTGHSCAFIHALHPRVLVIPAQSAVQLTLVIPAQAGIHRGHALRRDVARDSSLAQNDNGHGCPAHSAPRDRRDSSLAQNDNGA
jgi:hypothetical protein